MFILITEHLQLLSGTVFVASLCQLCQEQRARFHPNCLVFRLGDSDLIFIGKMKQN